MFRTSPSSLTIRLLRPRSTSSRQSHIGSLPIQVPPSITILHDPTPLKETRSAHMRNNTRLTVKGPKGEEDVWLMPFVKISYEQGVNSTKPSPSHSSSKTTTNPPSTTSSDPTSLITIPPPSTPSTPPTFLNVSVLDSTIRTQRSMWGLTRVLLSNAVEGVSTGYTTTLKFVGVGYRASLETKPRKRLNLRLYSAHPVYVEIPEGIEVEVPEPTRILLKGSSKEKLGLFAAKIREHRKPEPYNGKGIFVNDETVRRKDVKKK